MPDKIIGIGGSAGSLAPLKRLLQDLPPDLPAAVFVTMHIPSWRRSELAAILADSGPLPAQPGVHGEPISAGRIYVAPPDHHLMIDDSHVSLWRGPKENLQRPAINVLFRSAAAEKAAETVRQFVDQVRSASARSLINEQLSQFEALLAALPH